MDFFEHQEQARSGTRKLIALFAVAVIALIIITTLFICVAIYLIQTNSEGYFASIEAIEGHRFSLQWLNLEVGLWVTLGVISAVAITSYLKWLSLRSGGSSVALSLGGHPVQPNTDDPDEKMLLNVVEEMAIAAGVTVPSVYLIEQPSINAFAAGYHISDAVIGVTRGCISQLNRDQLQGVVAHEFSHILYGDMRINMRLIAALSGLLIIGLAGRLLLSSGSHRSRYRSSRSRQGQGGLAIIGLGLMAIGYSGTFFGRMIKASVSRQREFLADASAVQFTRNPDGIAGALQVLYGHQSGSALGDTSEEYSHLLFGKNKLTAKTNWFDTHPPLPERIQRILPNWDGEIAQGRNQESKNALHTSMTEGSDAISAFSHPTGPLNDSAQSNDGKAASLDTIQSNSDPLQIVDRIGQLEPENIASASKIIKTIPSALREACNDPYTSRAIVYGLLISDDELDNDKQLEIISNHADKAVVPHIAAFYRMIRSLPIELRIPLFELTIPALKLLSENQYRQFKRVVIALIRADNKVSLFEWSLYRILTASTEPQGLGIARYSLSDSQSACRLLLTALTQQLQLDSSKAQTLFDQACEKAGVSTAQLNINNDISFQAIDKALQRLNRLKPLEKPRVMKALFSLIQSEQPEANRQWQMLKAIALSLDCPIPAST